MIDDRLQSIADNIKTKLSDHSSAIADNIKTKSSDHSSAIKEIEQRLSLLQESKGENRDACMHFLLKTACEFNLLKETHDLLELNLFQKIDQPLAFEKKEPDRYRDNGKTLLGLAAFHGHYELASYLVEVRMANVNAKDMNGDTPLHQVVYGDSHPFNHSSCYRTAHDKVAKYLIRQGGDLSVKNNKEETPHDITKRCAPLKVENMVGRRFITNTGPGVYYADKVRPIFEKALARLKRDQHIPVIRMGGERQAQNFEKFCLEHAVEEYVKDKKAAFGYSSIEELYKALDSLSEEEWKHMRMIISLQRPAPYSVKFSLFSDQLPKMGTQSALLGWMVTLITYYETQNILLSVTAGSLSAILAWSYLTETAYKQKANERSVKKERVSDLQQRNHFFKSPQCHSIQRRQQLSDIQRELDGASTNTSGNLKYKSR